MNRFTLGEVREIVAASGEVEAGLRVNRVVTDSREARPGDLFVALSGERFDGHDFLEEVTRRGAVGAIVTRDSPRTEPSGIPLLRVSDAVVALAALARAHRERLAARVVAVTGSNGKTTTKDLIAHLLRAEGRHVTAAKKSFNNHLGVPLTLLDAEDTDEAVILEVGTNAPGEIARLGRLARPDVAVITNVSETHLAGLGSVEGVAREKATLLETLPERGTAVLNADNRWTAAMADARRGRTFRFGCRGRVEIRGADVSASPDGVRFRWVGHGDVHLPMLGGWNAYNVMAAFGAALALGATPEDLPGHLSSFRPPPMRMQVETLSGITFINDAYNANPRSTQLALDEFELWMPYGRKVLVLGDMGELGEYSEAAHRRLAERIARMALYAVLLVGPKSRSTWEVLVGSADPQCRVAHHAGSVAAGPALASLLRPGDLVLIKGSRAMQMERILEPFA